MLILILTIWPKRVVGHKLKKILFEKGHKAWCGSEIFISIVILGTIITISGRNWALVWLGLELNMVAFLG